MRSCPGLDFHFVGCQSLQVYPVIFHRKHPPCLNQLAEIDLCLLKQKRLATAVTVTRLCNSIMVFGYTTVNNPNSKSTLAFLALVINLSLLDQWFPNTSVCMLIHPRGLVKNRYLGSTMRIFDLMRQESTARVHQGRGPWCQLQAVHATGMVELNKNERV